MSPTLNHNLEKWQFKMTAYNFRLLAAPSNSETFYKMCTRVGLQCTENSQQSFSSCCVLQKTMILLFIVCFLIESYVIIRFCIRIHPLETYLRSIFTNCSEGNRKIVSKCDCIFLNNFRHNRKCKIVAISWFCDLAYYTRLKNDALCIYWTSFVCV